MAASVLFKTVMTHAPGRLLLEASRKPGIGYRRVVLSSDLRVGGKHRVTGTVAVSGTPDVPVVRKVRLIHKLFAAFIARETWSAADGVYLFEGIDRGPWALYAADHTGEYNAVIADNIFGEPM